MVRGISYSMEQLRALLGNSLEKLRHPRSDAYSAE